jgi:Adenylate cyclase regulatory domain
MRQAALEAVLQPGVSELQIAQAYEALVRQISPLLGPMIEDLLRLQLRHSLETEAVNAAERAAGTLPGARQVAVHSLTSSDSPALVRRCRPRNWNSSPADWRILPATSPSLPFGSSRRLGTR